MIMVITPVELARHFAIKALNSSDDVRESIDNLAQSFLGLEADLHKERERSEKYRQALDRVAQETQHGPLLTDGAIVMVRNAIKDPL